VPHPTLERWHQIVRSRDASALDDLLSDDVVLHSPIIQPVQRGRAAVRLFLGGAFKVFFNDSYRYIREITGPNDAVLEFETVVNGVLVNGVDLFRFDDAGRIVELKVMLRPLKSIDQVHEQMAELLNSLKGAR